MHHHPPPAAHCRWVRSAAIVCREHGKIVVHVRPFDPLGVSTPPPGPLSRNYGANLLGSSPDTTLALGAFGVVVGILVACCLHHSAAPAPGPPTWTAR